MGIKNSHTRKLAYIGLKENACFEVPGDRLPQSTPQYCGVCRDNAPLTETAYYFSHLQVTVYCQRHIQFFGFGSIHTAGRIFPNRNTQHTGVIDSTTAIRHLFHSAICCSVGLRPGALLCSNDRAPLKQVLSTPGAGVSARVSVRGTSHAHRLAILPAT